MKKIISLFIIILFLFSFGSNLYSNRNIHAWYYIWYHFPSINNYDHWGTQGCGIATGYRLEMPTISSNFYPSKGSYDSLNYEYKINNQDLVVQHARELKRAGVGVAIISIWRHHIENPNAVTMIKHVMQVFNNYGIKSTFALEPCTNPNGNDDGFYSIKSDDTVQNRYFPDAVAQLLSTFSNQENYWYKITINGNERKLIYPWATNHETLYGTIPSPMGGNSNIIQWRIALSKLEQNPITTGKVFVLDHGQSEIRLDLSYSAAGTGFIGQYNYDGTVNLDSGHAQVVGDIMNGGYLYDGGISPGYDDRRAVPPAIQKGERLRLNGNRFRDQFDIWDSIPTSFISVVTFNEWHEGTQIEPAEHDPPNPNNCMDYKVYSGNVDGIFKSGEDAEGMYLDIMKNLVDGSSYNLVLIQPNGNEHIDNGTTYEIKWDQSGDMGAAGGNVVIKLVDLNGNEISTVYDGPNTGTFNWTVSSIPIDEYKMQITSEYFTDISDESNDSFNVEPVGGGTPTITISSPTSSSSWSPGTSNTIAWSTYGTQDSNTKIELFKNSTFESTISLSTANDGSFDWPIDSNQTEGYDYQICITTLDGIVTDDSEFFAITSIPIGDSIIVTSPISSSDWIQNSTYTVTWNKYGTMNNLVKLRIYQDGVKILGISDSTENDGVYSWTVPSTLPPASNYSLRVRTLDNLVTGDSEEFTISQDLTGATITVTSPVLSDEWTHNETYLITWDKTGTMNSNVKLRLQQNGSNIVIITDSTSNDGEYSWTVPSSVPYASDYVIMVKTIDSVVFDTSDEFTVSPAAIIVTNPSSSSNWEQNSTYTVTWDKSGTMHDFVKLRIYQNEVIILGITDSTENDGSYTWTVPDTLPIASDYVLRVKTLDNLVYDDSDEFNITVENPDPFITLTSPDYSSEWEEGGSVNITWSKFGDQSANVNIYLYLNEQYHSDIALNVPNSDSYTWTIPTGLVSSNKYQVMLETTDSVLSDDSNLFSIFDDGITVTMPELGDTLTKGENVNITWKTIGSHNSLVKIHLLKNGIQTRIISSSTENDGTHNNWELPLNLANEDDYMIKIKTIDDLVSDDSDVLKVRDKGILVTFPSTNDVLKKGSQYTITWDKFGSQHPDVKIRLYQNGINILGISDSTPNDGSYEWTVPASLPNASNLTIRVKTLDNQVSDDSGEITIEE